MKATVWGCRGSLATPGADTVRYGGNTSCVEVTLDSGHRIVLDAGTGMRPLGVQINGDGRELHIMLTHLHLDHLQGLGFFRPLFDPGLEVHLWGPASPVQSLEERIAIYLSPPLFPVHLSDIPARLVFHDEPHHVAIGSATVHAANVTHQGPTVGYRIEEHGKVLAYLPDHEPAIGGDLDHQPPDWISGHEVAHDADVLFHDAQYGDRRVPDACWVGPLERRPRLRVRAQARRRPGRAVPSRPVPHRRRARSAARRHAAAVARRGRPRLPRARGNDRDPRRRGHHVRRVELARFG